MGTSTELTMADNFRSFIIDLLGKCSLPKNYIAMLTNSDNIVKFKQAFTHESASTTHNYEVYETLGDVTLNKCVIWYFRRMIPDITPEKLTLLKIKFTSTKLMSIFARELEFDKHIIASNDTFKHKRKILEDVLESFIGCVEYLIDDQLQMHLGYKYVYAFISFYIESYINEININESEDLMDPISILKNMSDKHRFLLEYVHEPLVIHGIKHVQTKVVIDHSTILSVEVSRSKKLSKGLAAKSALNAIKHKGTYGSPITPP